MSSDSESELQGDEHRLIVRVGDTVRRPSGWWTPAVHFAEVPDRRLRLEVFADAYGLTTTSGLIDDVIARQRLTILHVEVLAVRGLEPQVTWVADGTLDRSRQLVVWAEENRELFT